MTGHNELVQKVFSATTAATPDDLFDVVADLETYPHWLDVVDSVDRTDGDDAWIVTLRARVGPFARSKRLRMVRIDQPAAQGSEQAGGTKSVRFERQEVDGKEHSAWDLAANVSDLGSDAAGDAKSTVELDLKYDGGMWSGMLDGVLDAAADRATAKLQDYVRP